MIISSAREILERAHLRRNFEECLSLSNQILHRAFEKTGHRFKIKKCIVNNRNSACFHVATNSQSFFLKINKNCNSNEVVASAKRMELLRDSELPDELKIPATIYMDSIIDAVLMEYVDGRPLDAYLKCSKYSVSEGALKKAAKCLAAIHQADDQLGFKNTSFNHDEDVRMLFEIFPKFSKKYLHEIHDLAKHAEEKFVSIHGDYSPKNIFFSMGDIHVIDFSANDSHYPMFRDLAIFKVGLKKSFISLCGIRVLKTKKRIDLMLDLFFDEYYRCQGLEGFKSDVYNKGILFYEIIRLAEMKIWLDGYKKFNESKVGWLKSLIGNLFVNYQLKLIGKKLDK
jgi:serine/threonine protein kinase